MTKLVSRALWSLLAILVVVATGVTMFVTLRSHSPPGVPPELVPASWGKYRTSAGHLSHVGAGKAECRDCHDFEHEGFRNPTASVCGKCHAKQTTHVHRGGIGPDATDCLTCHLFAPDRVAPTCIGCHAKPHGAFPAIAQHTKVDCAKCHRIHDEPSVALAECTGCHDERASTHAAHAGSKGCLDCHRAHEPASASVSRCSSCHAQPAGPHPAGHQACVDCHRPHEFAAGGERACIGCHGAKTTLGATHVPAHSACIDCHTPHAPADASASCVRCHSGVLVSHGNKGECVTCHVPHGDDPLAKALACTSCHKNVATSDDTGAHAGGIACVACHKPHRFAGFDGKTVCKDCHEHEVTLAASNKGHTDCASCHGASAAHLPAKSPACGTCHGREQATAPAGHQKCQACHDPHAGRPTPSCSTCHQAKTAGPHKTVQGGCESCHRAHGPNGVAAPPACTSCHVLNTLPALHATAGHAICASCHPSSHEPARADRATCTGSCHADKRGHQPSAVICNGCHVFRR